MTRRTAFSFHYFLSSVNATNRNENEETFTLEQTEVVVVGSSRSDGRTVVKRHTHYIRFPRKTYEKGHFSRVFDCPNLFSTLFFLELSYNWCGERARRYDDDGVVVVVVPS